MLGYPKCNFYVNIVLISVIGTIILLIIAILILRRIIKRKNRNLIPEEVLSDFMKAEQMLKDSKGTITHQEVLWNIYKERNNIKEFCKSLYVEPITETKPKENKLLKLFKRR